MANNRKRGFDRERRIASKYRKNGCIAIRSGASIGCADVLIIDPKSKHILMIQSKITKNGYLSPKEKEAYLKEFAKYEGTYTLKGILDISKSRRKA